MFSSLEEWFVGGVVINRRITDDILFSTMRALVVYSEIVYNALLIIYEKFFKNFCISNHLKFYEVFALLCETLEPKCQSIIANFELWSSKELTEIYNELNKSTIEEIEEDVENVVFNQVFYMIDFILENNYHHFVFHQLQANYHENMPYELDIKNHRLYVPLQFRMDNVI